MYDWEVVRVSGMKLESTLKGADAKGWEVFAIIQAGEEPTAPPNDRYYYTIVVRRRQQEPNQ
jgi:hypothetical protein